MCVFFNTSMIDLFLFCNAVDLARDPPDFHHHRARNLLHGAAQHDRCRSSVERCDGFKRFGILKFALYAASLEQHIDNAALDQLLQYTPLLFRVVPLKLRASHRSAERLCKHRATLCNQFCCPKPCGVR